MSRIQQPTAKTYRDRVECPVTKKTFTVQRRTFSAGCIVSTYCRECKKMHMLLAGQIKARKW